MEKTISRFTLSCGLRVIIRHTTSPVLYCGYIVCAGTRHEEPEDTGMAHFIEHLNFKGTADRPASRIADTLERVGGDLNAYTNKQETVYYATVLNKDFARAADLLTDIVFHSIYPEEEMRKEAEVVCDEIESFKDSPSELIFDEFEAGLFKGHALGRDILGAPERLRDYKREDVLRFVKRYYRPANAVFYVSGQVSDTKVQTILERLWKGESNEKAVMSSSCPTGNHAETRRIHLDTHQAHVLIGARTYGGFDNRRFPLMLLNNVLGGPGMNSRLNQRLREKAGLVYSVDSSLTTYPDTGWWGIYFGCDAHDVSRCLKMAHKEIQMMIERPFTPRTLSAAKKQLCGQIMVSCDNAESYALAMGKTLAWYDSIYSPERLCQRLNEVTSEDMARVAAEVYELSMQSTLIYE